MMFDVSGSRRFYRQGRIWFDEYAYYHKVTATQSYRCKVRIAIVKLKLLRLLVICFTTDVIVVSFTIPKYNNNKPLFYGHHTSQPALASTPTYELEDFVGAKFYCPHAVAGGNQCIRTR